MQTYQECFIDEIYQGPMMAFSYGHSCSTSTRCHYHWKLEHIWNFNQMTIKTMILGVCLNVREQIAFSDVLIINLEAPCLPEIVAQS